MKRLWSAFLTSVLTAGPALAQTLAPSPRPVVHQTGPVHGGSIAPLAIPGPPTVPVCVAEGGCDTGCCNLAKAWRNNACGCDTVCGPAGRVWGEFDYLLWQPRGDNLPSLLT